MSYLIEIYRIDVATNSFVAMDEFDTFVSLDFFTRLDGIGGCVFTLDINTIKARANVLRRSVSQVVIKKGDGIVWVGPITKILRNYRGTGGTVTIQAQEYISHLYSRYTGANRQFTGVDAGTIATTLISETQAQTNGGLVISAGTIETTQNRDRTYEYANIGREIQRLTQVDGGFDYSLAYSIDANKRLDGVVFNVQATRGRVRSDLPKLTLGGNVMAVNYSTQNDIANSITALGVGTGAGIISSNANDTNSQGSFTRRELVLPQKEISIKSTLQETAQAELEVSAGEVYHVECELVPGSNPRLGDFILGDILRLDLSSDPSSFITLDSTARCIELAVNVDQNGAETISPKFVTNI